MTVHNANILAAGSWPARRLHSTPPECARGRSRAAVRYTAGMSAARTVRGGTGRVEIPLGRQLSQRVCTRLAVVVHGRQRGTLSTPTCFGAAPWFFVDASSPRRVSRSTTRTGPGPSTSSAPRRASRHFAAPGGGPRPFRCLILPRRSRMDYREHAGPGRPLLLPALAVINKTPMLHWGQATMFARTELLAAGAERAGVRELCAAAARVIDS